MFSASTPDAATVVAARAGDSAARDRLVAGCLPLVYNIVGRALGGHADVDDVVQETMLRMLRGLEGLRDPGSFRSWLVAIAIRQVRDRYRAGRTEAVPPEDLAGRQDAGSDFADLTILRLELSGQRRETVEATRWLDHADRELLSLWWLEAAGELTRDEVVAAVGGDRAHVAVGIQRMKTRLDAARAVVRALEARPLSCADLLLLTAGWDGRPSGLWRKRLARHTRECGICSSSWSGLIRPENLLVGLALVPASALLVGWLTTSPGPGPGAAGGGLGAEAAGVATAGTADTAALSGSAAGGAASLPAASGGAAGALSVAGLSGKALVAVASVLAVLAAGAGVLAASFTGPDRAPTELAVASGTPTPGTPVPTPEPGQLPPPGDPDESVTEPTEPTEPAGTDGPPAGTPGGQGDSTPSAGSSEPPDASVPPAAGGGPKKGVATWEFPHVPAALTDMGAAWFYNWSPTDETMPAPPGVEFVPMIWGEDSVNDRTLATAAGKGEVLLGFNEPDLGEQADMSVERALELWPKLEATGMRLGSPAVAWGAAEPGGWLDRFMAGAEARGMRVDFITLHWYGSDFGEAAVGHFREYLEATYQRYGLPIWVTEYGLMDFGGSPRYPSDEQLVSFVRGSTAMMEALPYVERYAWFGLPAEGEGIGLYRDGRTPTPAGAAYREAGPAS